MEIFAQVGKDLRKTMLFELLTADLYLPLFLNGSPDEMTKRCQ
jgi:hypothetical protein